MKALYFLTVTLVAFIAQTTSYHIFTPIGTCPDFILIITIYIGSRFGSNKGVWYGALIGFLQDLSSYGSLGVYTLTKGCIGFVTGHLRDRFVVESAITSVIFTVGALFFDMVIYGLISWTIFGYDLSAPLFKTAPMTTLLTVGFALPLFHLIDYGAKRVERMHDKPGEKYLTNPYR